MVETGIGIITVEVKTCVEIGISVEVGTCVEIGISVEVGTCVEIGNSVKVEICVEVDILVETGIGIIIVEVGTCVEIDISEICVEVGTCVEVTISVIEDGNLVEVLTVVLKSVVLAGKVEGVPQSGLFSIVRQYMSINKVHAYNYIVPYTSGMLLYVHIHNNLLCTLNYT